MKKTIALLLSLTTAAGAAVCGFSANAASEKDSTISPVLVNKI